MIPFENSVSNLDSERKLHEARDDIASLRGAFADLQLHGEKQAVLLRALFELLHEKLGIGEVELLDRFRRIATEKASAPAKMCSKCGRAVNLRHQRCMYCDAPCVVASAFDLL